MQETKRFPTLHVASAITGVGLCDGMKYSTIHEIAEFLAGHPVWTHELGHLEMMQRISDHAREQFPAMPTEEEAQADFRAAAVKALAAYGETVTVRRGSLERGADPISTLVEMVGEKGGDA